ncbi:MAG TPA: DUF5302 domain-containing protein [Nocardioidaceae bacterium]|nr:DUF5302 domain-containing protein [Nocardioidaceae bacterium]
MAANINRSADNDDLKAKMREALARKQAHARGVDHPAGSQEKVHGPELHGGAPTKFRRKVGGGGA